MIKTILISLPIEDLQTVIIDCVNSCLMNNKQESKQTHLEQPTEREELLTPKETAELLKISIPTLWRWQKKGKLNCYGIAGKRYYKRSEVIESLTSKK